MIFRFETGSIDLLEPQELKINKLITSNIIFFMYLKFCNLLIMKQLQNFYTHVTASLSHNFF